MKDIILTNHFKLSEFTRSATAASKGIDNAPSLEVVSNLQQLCIHVLEPLREHVGQAVTIGSGFRCKALNTAVGGVTNSQHMTGEAADIQAPKRDAQGKTLTEAESQKVLREWFEWLMDQDFDQLILEKNTKDSNHYWIHVSYKQGGGNRHKVIEGLVKNRTAP